MICTVHLHTLGDIARSCVNPVVSQMSQYGMVSVKVSASANPASRVEGILSSASMGVLLSTARWLVSFTPLTLTAPPPPVRDSSTNTPAVEAIMSDSKINEMKSHMQTESLKMAAIQTQVTGIASALEMITAALGREGMAEQMAPVDAKLKEVRSQFTLLSKSITPPQIAKSGTSGGGTSTSGGGGLPSHTSPQRQHPPRPAPPDKAAPRRASTQSAHSSAGTPTAIAGGASPKVFNTQASGGSTLFTSPAARRASRRSGTESTPTTPNAAATATPPALRGPGQHEQRGTSDAQAPTSASHAPAPGVSPADLISQLRINEPKPRPKKWS